ncbi:MAG: stage II sporulation protein M, partial [Gorillibacterium sp.]|nr:stage II sporulation protein M [Gorillibacterium sp.]
MPFNNSVIKSHFQEHFSIYMFVSVIFTIGVVFGSVLVSALTLDMNQDIARHLGNFFAKMDQGLGIDPVRSFWTIFGLNVKWLLLIWLLGMSVVGLPVVLVLNFLKGALVGFTVSFMITEYAWEGVLFSLTAVLPQNLILIPIMLVSSASAVIFSLYLVRNRFLKQNGSIYHPFSRYCLLTLLLVALVAGISLFEAYGSPELMRAVTPVLANLLGLP